MRVLIVDAQVFQTAALYRGMGKYSIELLKAVIEANNNTNEQWGRIELLLSSKMPLSEEAKRQVATIKGVHLTLLPLRKDIIYRAKRIMKKNRKIIDGYVNRLKKADASTRVDYLILSPMQGGISSVFPSNPLVNKIVICYDLIPFMFHTTYFRNPIARVENLSKTTELLCADVFLAISQTVANDLSVHLGVDPDRITSIDGGPISHSSTEKPYSTPGPFILMPTGDDIRKNNRTGILGFAEFNKKHENKYHLVITSFFDPDLATELSKLSPNVIFTGNISGDELAYLYEHCEALLFPSEYEGLGLPVLEAMEHTKPIACSDIAVFREISKTELSYFDPAYSASVATALEDAMMSKPSKEAYRRILKKYSWKRTADLLMSATSELKAKPNIQKSKVAVFGLNPEINHPSARLIQRSYAELSGWVDPDFFLEGLVDQPGMRANALRYVNETRMITDETALNVTGYKHALYHIANHRDLKYSLFAALANPGIVILYDLDLTSLWQSLLAAQLIDRSRFETEERLTKKYDSHRTAMLCSLLANQKAVVVFTESAKNSITKLLQAMGSRTSVVVLKYPTSSLKYPAIVPDKTGKIAVFNPGSQDGILEIYAQLQFIEERWIITGTGDPVPDVEGARIVAAPLDKDYEEAVSRVDAIFANHATSWGDVIEAARYGVPTLTKRGSLSPYHAHVEEGIMEVSDENEAAAKLRDLGLERGALEGRIQVELYERLHYKNFARELYRVMERVE